MLGLQEGVALMRNKGGWTVPVAYPDLGANSYDPVSGVKSVSEDWTWDVGTHGELQKEVPPSWWRSPTRATDAARMEYFRATQALHTGGG